MALTRDSLAQLCPQASDTWLDDVVNAQLERGGRREHGDAPSWREAIAHLPEASTAFDATGATVVCGRERDASVVPDALRALNPWRKGPFSVDGIRIDAEWRSDWKWLRLARHVVPLARHAVLDVGCGNGYYMMRALGSGARSVTGLEPGALARVQFEALCRRAGGLPAGILPLRLEELPPGRDLFDTILCMGVLYHSRMPVEQISMLRRLLRPGGQLVLETLVVDGDAERVMVPPGRYARMRNVWFLPSCLALERWLARSGFANWTLINVNRTASAEQRPTEWMTYDSLSDALYPGDIARTVEGHPAPTRAMWLVQG